MSEVDKPLQVARRLMGLEPVCKHCKHWDRESVMEPNWGWCSFDPNDCGETIPEGTCERCEIK